MSNLIKHYQDTMKGIPQLTNSWGAMITLLDAVLITGFNHVPVLGLSKSGATAITATINLGSNHGFIDRQVVRIAGSTNGWDGDYKVLSADTSSITIECTTEHPTVISGTATCFTAPLDFEIVHQTPTESTTPKRAYRSTDPESLGLILLVHDFCNVGASTTGAKFAKVGVVSDMSDIDTIVGSQIPFDPVNPNTNWGWDGTYHGWAKWYYANPAYSYNYDQKNDTAAPSNGNRTFCIVGDSISFAMSIHSQGCVGAYGFVEFYDASYLGKNLTLLATNTNGQAVAQNKNMYMGGRCGYGGYFKNADYGVFSELQRGLLWFGSNGLHQPAILRKVVRLATYNTDDGFIPLNTPNNCFLQDFIFDSSDMFRGVLPFFRKTMKLANTIVVTDEGKTLVSYLADYNNCLFALCLEAR